MSVFDIGNYRIQMLNQGGHIVSWQDKRGNRYSINMDLSEWLDRFIQDQLIRLEYLLYIFDNHPDTFLSEAEDILNNINEPEPPSQLFSDPSFNLKPWYHQQIIQAYNSIHQTNFTYEMVINRVPW